MGQGSKLDNSYTDSEVFPDGYLVKRKDRNARGGGVFIAYRDNLVVNEVKGSGKNCQLVVLKVEVWMTAFQSLQSDLEKIQSQCSPKINHVR